MCVLSNARKYALISRSKLRIKCSIFSPNLRVTLSTTVDTIMHSNKGGTGFKSEAKSKIGDYIRGKISAQSLMHPSRINTKPIDKRQFALNAPSSLNYNNLIKPEYQRKARRPPLKDYIEGKAKLSDMISPSKIVHIPKERKYQPEVRTFPEMADGSLKRRVNTFSTENSVKIVNDNCHHQHHNNNQNSSLRQSMRSAANEWSVTTLQTSAIPNDAAPKTELTLIPIKTLNTHAGSQRRRKVMCKIKKIQRSGNSATGGEEVTEERIIEIPESILRERQKVPKFLMDRYNIPCCVTAGGATFNEHKPLAIEDQAISDENGESEVLGIESITNNIAEQQFLVSQRVAVVAESECESEGKGENSLAVDTKNSRDTSADNLNLPSEQGDYNSTTYIFEFYEETIPPTSKSAVIEEIDDDNGHRTDDSDRNDDSFGHDMPQTSYEDYKSQIYLQRELLDLHRGMLKCDKNVMVVEHSVNQVAASLNMIETVQNQEIKPVIMSMKSEYDDIKTQVESLQTQNEQLRTTLKCLRKRNTDYEKLLHFFNEDSTMKIQELENKLQTITQAQVKSIEMQNVVNKNIFKMTHQIRRTYSEMDSSRHCASSVVKSQKNSNSSVTNLNIM